VTRLTGKNTDEANGTKRCV